MTPLVSIIIPTYNRAEYIGKALCSASSQTFTDYEIIVVDDQSEDETAQVLSESGVPLVYHRIPHSGISGARNAGIARAQGEVVAFLDSDDWWEPNFLLCAVNALAQAPIIGFTCCDYAQWNELGLLKPASFLSHEKISGDIFFRTVEGMYIHISSLVVRRACFEKVGLFDPAINYVDDWDFMLRLSQIYQGVYLDQVLLNVLIHSGSISRQTMGVCLNNLKVLQKLKGQAPTRWRTHRDALKKVVSYNHRTLVSHYRREGNVWRMGQHGLSYLFARVGWI